MITLLLLFACLGDTKKPPTGTADADTDADSDADTDTDRDSDSDTGTDSDTDTDTDLMDSDGDGSPDGDDCSPSNDQIYPGAEERCNGYDDNCDGAIDDATSVDATIWYTDADGDNYGDQALAPSCRAPATSASNSDDCDDANPAIHPDAQELCNGLDDDCDSVIDPDSSGDAPTWYSDADSDTWGDPAVSSTSCEAPVGSVPLADDCDDSNPAVHPEAMELCNGLDDDCDSVIDPDSSLDASTFYSDTDGDTYGDPSSPLSSCSQPVGATSDGADCDDGEATVNPGAQELCNDRDDDCDTVIDPDSSLDASTWYADVDGDTQGDVSDVSVACDAPPGTVADSADCDDTLATTFVGASELCDGIDQDCDGVVDNDATDAGEWFQDADGDGYGLDSSLILSCEQPSGWAVSGGDCDDADPATNPGASEICGDGFDQDCDGVDTGDADCAPSGTITSPDATLSGSAVYVTSALAITADLDGDGHDELVVGASSWSLSTGAAYVFDDVGTGTSRTTTGADWRFEGAVESDSFGVSVAALGDVDGDGLPELAVGAPGDDGYAPGAGAVYIYSGAAAAHVAAYTTSEAGGVLQGANASDAAGSSVGNAGDVDGDGLDDLWIGAAGYDSTDSTAGAVYVAFGDILGSGTLGTTNQARFDGERASDAISHAASVGDVDGDGYGDLAIGSTGSDERASSAGTVWIWRGPLHPGQYEVAAAQTHIVGTVASDAVGSAITGGDFDADGYSDVVVGAEGTDYRGSAAGTAALFYGPLPIGELELGSADTTLTGTAVSDGVGQWLSAGDIDGDGRDDLALGVPGSDIFGSGVGGTFAYYGPIASGHSTLSDADLMIADGSSAGQGVLVADLDRDGFADLSSLNGAGTYDQIEVTFGGSGSTAVAPAPDLSTDDDGDGYSENAGDCDDGRATRSPGLTEVCDAGGDENCDGYADRCAPGNVAESALDQQVVYDHTDANYQFGSTVSIIGDVNGDGALDVAAQDSIYSSHAGRTLIFFGPLPSGSLTCASADAEIDGDGSSYGDVGMTLSNAGDLDGDGFDDLFVGADGAIYIFRGGPTLSGVLTASMADWTLTHDSGYADLGTSGGGRTDLDGDGNDDLVFGSDGTSSRVYVAFGPVPLGASAASAVADLIIDGGEGTDTYGLDAQGWGDLTGDGLDDLLVHSDNGDRFLLFAGPLASGTLDDLDARAILMADPTGYGTGEPEWTVGDLTGDGLGDLVVSNDDASWAVVPLAAVQGAMDVDQAAVAVISDGSSSVDSGYGIGITVGDLDRNGSGDLVVGYVTGYNDNGEVHIFYGPLSGTYAMSYDDVTVTGDSDYMLGSSVSAGDIDQDGFADVVMGAVDYGTSTWEYGAFGLLRGGWTDQTVGAPDPIHTSIVDADDDGFTGAEGDCDDFDPSIGPTSPEVCDGVNIDEDCDGFAAQCSTGDRFEAPVQVMIDGNTSYGMIRGIGDVDGDGRAEAIVSVTANDVYVTSPPYANGRELDPADFSGGAFIDTPASTVALETLPDVDGDGALEFSIGSQDGTLWLFDSAGGISNRAVSTAAWIFTETASGRWGDVADGGDDAFGDSDGTLMIGAPYDSSVAPYYQGAAYVFSVSDAARGNFTVADARITVMGDMAGDQLGYKVKVLGDCDGDGLSEVAMASPRGSATDKFYIWTSDGAAGTLATTDLPIVVTDSTSLRTTVYSPGDLDGDGTRDVVFADHYAYNGMVYGWSGLPPTGTTALTVAEWTIEGSLEYEELGQSVVEDVDFDGDGQVDLITSAPNTSAYPYEPGIIYGFLGPITRSMTSDEADVMIQAQTDGDDFGAPTVAAGDVDGDGFDDLWAGKYGLIAELVRGGPRD